MESFLERLKSASNEQRVSASLVKEKKNKIATENPSVVCSITLGKELHAGHMFLLTIAEQARLTVESKLPLILINNNTGPRSAAALVTYARNNNLTLTEAAKIMDSGYTTFEEVVNVYRNRSNDDGILVSSAIDILNTGDYDIFATPSKETSDMLRQAGFNINIISESFIVKASQEKVKTLNDNWKETGFTPVSDGKRLVVLQKGGSLTATGTMLTSITTLSERLDSDLCIIVDSMADSQDASFVFSQMSDASSIQVPGAGVGFEGMLASGTTGESLTMKELANTFYSKRPDGNLQKVVQYFTLTRPLSLPSDTMDLTQSFYDFYDNASLVEAIIKTGDEYLGFKENLAAKLQDLESKISMNTSTSDRGAAKLIEFLPQRAESLLKPNIDRDLSALKRLELMLNKDMGRYLKEVGYDDVSPNLYKSGFRKLAIRKNYYYSYLTALLKTIKEIDSLKLEEFNTIYDMVACCIKRAGL